MSGSLPIQPPESALPETSGSSSDPTSSLRAAALLTLKSKRRRVPFDLQGVQSHPSHPSRPPPPDTGFQLDYGQEDNVPSSSPTSAPVIASPPRLADCAEGSQVREEGEISDEEDAQPSPKLRSRSSTPSPGIGRHLVPSASSQEPSSKPRLSNRITDLPFTPVAGQSTTPNHTGITDVEHPSYVLDTDHVRPGVALNQHQYDAAKDVVLDLLGWGVPPEYLVECGLTKEIVFYVFSELNLRLPHNLDTTGIIPYTPELLSSIKRHKSSLSLENIPPYSYPDFSRPHNTNSNPSPKIKASTVLPTGDPPSLTTDPIESAQVSTDSLHDMEQQRRQELLARKAVIASRKLKQLPSHTPSTSPTSISHSDKQDANMTVPTETVDDFLKSIEPSALPPNADENSSNSDATHVSRNAEDMDIDEISGLEGTRSSSQYSHNSPVTDSRDSVNQATPISPAQSIFGSQSPREYPPSSTESTATIFPQNPVSDSSEPIENHGLQRRGTKRPVAADFVDFDNGVRPHSNGGYSNGLRPTSRPKMSTGFASVSGMRRCIIDLSDSEGEGDESMDVHDEGLGETESQHAAYSSPIPTRPLVSRILRTPPISTTPVATTLGIASGGNMSPAALIEKEIEIRKMREIIAQKEQRRMAKLAAATISKSNIENMDTKPLLAKQEKTEPITDNGTNNRTDNGHSITIPESSSYNTSRSGNSEDTKSGRADTGTQDITQVVNTSSTATSTTTINESVDVDLASSSSAQTMIPVHQRLDENRDQQSEELPTPQEQHDEHFTTYDSPFRWYPLLSSQPRPICMNSISARTSLSSFSSVSNSSSSLHPSSSLSSPFPSSSLLSISPSSMVSSYSSGSSSTVVVPNLLPLKLATTSKLLDPSKQICQYEVPGGGVCRDEECEDVHLSRITGHDGNGVEPSDQDTAEYLVNHLPTAWLAEKNGTHSRISSILQQVRLKSPRMNFEQRVAQALTIMTLT